MSFLNYSSVFKYYISYIYINICNLNGGYNLNFYINVLNFGKENKANLKVCRHF